MRRAGKMALLKTVTSPSDSSQSSKPMKDAASSTGLRLDTTAFAGNDSSG